MTEKESLFGGDLEAIVNLLKAVLNRLQYLLQTKADSLYNKESFFQEIFQNVLRTGSNMMSNQSHSSWMDLSRLVFTKLKRCKQIPFFSKIHFIPFQISELEESKWLPV